MKCSGRMSLVWVLAFGLGPPAVGAAVTEGADALLNPYAHATPLTGIRPDLLALQHGAAAASFGLADGWGGGLGFSSYQPRYPADLAFEPRGPANYALDGSLRGTTQLWSYPVAGVVDYKLQRWDLTGRNPAQSQDLRIGPQISFTADTTTQFYYRYARDVGRDGSLFTASPLRDTDSYGAGVAQVWHFADRRGQLRLGYEFADNRSEIMTQRMAGHRVNVAGSIPLKWGIQAQFQADYSRNIYPDYSGLRLESDRREFRAGLSSAFSDRFQANLNYIYADEDSADDALAYRRRAWGLNFSYKY